MNAPDGSMILGSPAKVVRELTEKEKESILANATLYLEKSKEYRAHAAKQAVVFGRDGGVVPRAGRCHQLLPGLLQKATFHGRFRHGHAQGRQQLGAGRCVIQLGQHAIQLGACGFLIQRRAAGLGQ
jgi:hypothetical protein